MPKPSKISASGSDRDRVARHLYHLRTADDASHRAESNTRFGTNDLSQALIKALELGEGDVVLDAGCGAGKHLQVMAGVVGASGQAIGTDFARDAMQRTTRRGIAGVLANAIALPLRAATIDAVSCAYAVYYFADLAAAVAQWSRVLRPGGRLVVAGPAAHTNAELYAFHRIAAAVEPSDADRMALGYVAGPVAEAVARAGFVEVRQIPFDNVITYPTSQDFLDYWCKTSLFLRSVRAPQREAVLAAGSRVLATREAPMSITKRTSVLTAAWAG